MMIMQGMFSDNTRVPIGVYTLGILGYLPEYDQIKQVRYPVRTRVYTPPLWSIYFLVRFARSGTLWKFSRSVRRRKKKKTTRSRRGRTVSACHL